MSAHTAGPCSVASILLREFCSYDRAIAYAERIARSASLNGNGAMAHEYSEAARMIREQQEERIEYWNNRIARAAISRATGQS